MSLDRQVRHYFHASEEKVRMFGAGAGKQDLEKGYRILTNARKVSGGFEYSNNNILTPEILILCAETAVKNQTYEIARISVNDMFLVMATTFLGALEDLSRVAWKRIWYF